MEHSHLGPVSSATRAVGSIGFPALFSSLNIHLVAASLPGNGCHPGGGRGSSSRRSSSRRVTSSNIRARGASGDSGKGSRGPEAKGRG